MRRPRYQHVIVRHPAATASTAVILVALLSGCVGASSQPDEFLPLTSNVSEALEAAESHGLDWEAGVLKDGTITATEYEDAYDRFRQCLFDLGYTPGIPKYLDPVSGTQWRSLDRYEGSEDPDEMALVMDKKCVGPLTLIETPYLAGTPQRMDARVLARFRECLDAHDLPYEGNEVNYNEFTEELSDHDFAYGPHFDCLVESVKDVYPDVIGVGVGR